MHWRELSMLAQERSSCATCCAATPQTSTNIRPNGLRDGGVRVPHFEKKGQKEDEKKLDDKSA
jgi:hypothetical protein